MLSITTWGTIIGVGAIATQLLDVYLKDFTGNRIASYRHLESFSGKGLILSKNVRISVELSNEHVLVVFPSGGGKSRYFIMPNVRNLKNCSMVVTDPSGEVEENCPREDMATFIYNPYDIEKSNVGFNPLANCKNSFEVRQVIEILMLNTSNSTQDNNSVGDKADWIQRSLPLLYAYAIYNFYTHKYDFDDMIINLMIKPLLPMIDEKGKPILKGQSIMEEIMNSDIDEAKIEILSFEKICKAQVTLACIRDTINSSLAIFKEPNIRKLCKKPTLNFQILRKKPCIFYIQIPERYARHYSAISATMIQQITNKLLDHPEGKQIFYLFDEFCNIGKVTDINSYLSTCRKSFISIASCIQNLIQFKKIYGDIEGDELRELFKTVLVSGGLKDSAEYFSKIMGTKKVKEDGIQKEEPLMTPSELRTMKKNEVIIITSNKKPVKEIMYS